MDKASNRFCGCAKKWFESEFHPRNFCPRHHDGHLFVQSQWSGGRITPPYVTYRICVSLLLIVWLILDIVTEVNQWYKSTPHLWFIFATNWGLLSLTISGVISLSNVVRFYIKQGQQIFQADILPPPSKIDGFLSLQWIVHAISSNSAIVISVAFWAFVVALDGPPFLKSDMSKLKHSVNTIYVFVDLFVIAKPIRLLHVIYPMMFGMAYVVFYSIYFAAGGVGPTGMSNAYEVIDWKKDPSSSFLACLFAFGMTIMSQLILYLVYKIRVSLSERLRESSDDEGQDNLSLIPEEEEDDLQESSMSMPKVPVSYHAIN